MIENKIDMKLQKEAQNGYKNFRFVTGLDFCNLKCPGYKSVTRLQILLQKM